MVITEVFAVISEDDCQKFGIVYWNPKGSREDNLTACYREFWFPW